MVQHSPRGLIGSVLVFSLAGCAAATTAIDKRDLTVETRTSRTIFLDPVPMEDRTIFVDVDNTSERPEFDLTPEVRSVLEDKGYRIVEDPAEARYMLQANVLQAGRTSETAAEKTFGGGFGSAVFGGAIGALAGRAASTDVTTIITGGLVGAAASAVADTFVEDVTYTVTTDVQISERNGKPVTQIAAPARPLFIDGFGGTPVKPTAPPEWTRHQTRIMSFANQVNLEFEEAAPQLVAGMTRTLDGIF
jgi:hypothetical protein